MSTSKAQTNPTIHEPTPPLPSTLRSAATEDGSDGRGIKGEGASFSSPSLDLRPSPLPTWPDPVDGRLLLDSLRDLLSRFVILPPSAAEALALWILHTYAFQLRDIATYIGIESPARRCGKTTLLTILSRLVHRPVLAANISPTALFRAIEELRPTLMIDEADTFLKTKDALQGILNAGYTKTGYVLRISSSASASASSTSSFSSSSSPLAPHPSSLSFFSCWCPKIICQIGSLPHTLADRCIVIRIQRKTPHEQCERLRDLETLTLQRQCARFVQDHAAAISTARPDLPASLNDRAADIWEPLFALADLAGGPWPDLARQAALHLSATANDNSPIGALLLDIFVIFHKKEADRLFTRDLVEELNFRLDRPWAAQLKGKPVTDLWLSHQLRPFGIKPRNLWIDRRQAKAYSKDDFLEPCRRYVSKSELDALKADCTTAAPPPTK